MDKLTKEYVNAMDAKLKKYIYDTLHEHLSPKYTGELKFEDLIKAGISILEENLRPDDVTFDKIITVRQFGVKLGNPLLIRTQFSCKKTKAKITIVETESYEILSQPREF